MIVPILAYLERVLAQSSFDLATWTKTNVTVTANTTTAPDGSVTADTLSDADAVNLGFIWQNFAVPNDSLTRLISIYVKAGTAPVIGLQAQYANGTGVVRMIAFNPTNGQFSAGSVAAAPTQVGVTNIGSGFWKVTFPITNNSSGNTILQIAIYPAFAAALAGSGLAFTTASVPSQTGTVIAWLASSKDSFIPTYPPINKDLSPELIATRTDSITSSGIKQSVTERVDSFQDFAFAYVPASDIPLWAPLMNNILAGGTLSYFPDSTDLSTSTDYTCEDSGWKPKRVAFGHAGFTIRLRQAVAG